MAVRLMALDLDGTLLDENKHVTPAVKKAVEEAADRGILPVPVTGRPLSGIPEEVMALPGVHTCITSNGALCFEDGREKFSAFLQEDIALGIAREAKRRGYLYSIFADGIGWADEKSHAALMAHFSNSSLLSYMEASRRPVAEWKTFQKVHGNRIENVWVRTPEASIADGLEEEIRTAAGKRVSTLRTLPMDVETVSSLADKGRAVTRLAEKLGIKREEILAIGDSPNDIGLLETAGISVAMGNAAKEVKDISAYETLDNRHDGAALAIRRFALGEG